jgi:hypothetical protein
MYPSHYMKAMAKDILVHGKSIFHNLQVAADSFKNKQYQDFGREFGTILKLATENLKEEEESLFLY